MTGYEETIYGLEGTSTWTVEGATTDIGPGDVILEYGVKERTPSQHVVVFDEAQRAWDREMMSIKKQVDASEPELLVRAGARVPNWCVLVGLVGDGQEIHSGEEGGLGQWKDAVERSPERGCWERSSKSPRSSPHDFAGQSSASG
jgi:hypothetical protein